MHGMVSPDQEEVTTYSQTWQGTLLTLRLQPRKGQLRGVISYIPQPHYRGCSPYRTKAVVGDRVHTTEYKFTQPHHYALLRAKPRRPNIDLALRRGSNYCRGKK